MLCYRTHFSILSPLKSELSTQNAPSYCPSNVWYILIHCQIHTIKFRNAYRIFPWLTYSGFQLRLKFTIKIILGGNELLFLLKSGFKNLLIQIPGSITQKYRNTILKLYITCGLRLVILGLTFLYFLALTI